jgi:hypothetical protein
MRTTFTDQPTQDKVTRSTGISAGAEQKLDGKPTKNTVERRSQPRYPLTAAATSVELTSGARLDARTTDVSVEGCYVDAMNPFPTGTVIHLRLMKDGKSFLTDATVEYCAVGMGMGLRFTAVAPEGHLTLEKWIHEVGGEVPPETYALEQDERVLSENNVNEQHYALEELLIVLMRKGLLTEEEGEPILRRLIRGAPSQNPLPG